MRFKFSAILLAAACAASMSLGVFASGGSVSLSGESKGSGLPAVYDYQALTFSGNKAVFGDKVYCSFRPLVQAGNGKYYRIFDARPLDDSACFRRSISTTTNAMAVKNVSAVTDSELRDGNKPSFCIPLAKDFVYQDTSVFFTVTYTAAADTELRVAALEDKAMSNPFEMSVKRGAKLSYDCKLLINDDTLFSSDYKRLGIKPYTSDDAALLMDPSATFGADGLIITPEKDEGDGVWMETESAVARLTNPPSNLPKLSTIWEEAKLPASYSALDAYVRLFRSHPAVSGTLSFSNPFITISGDETVKPEDVRIYELSESGSLKDVTSKFRFERDSDGNGYFSRTVSRLNDYVISSKALA